MLEPQDFHTIPKIKLGLLLNSYQVPKWVYDMMQNLIQAESIEIKALIVKQNHEQQIRKPYHLFKLLPFIVLQKLDRKVFSVKDDAFKMIDIRRLTVGASIIKVITQQTSFTDRLREDDIKKLQQLELDILYRVGFKILKGEILTNIARFGVWSFHHGDNKVNRGMPAAFWEVFHQENVCGATLQILSEELDNGNVIGKVFVPTVKFSYHKTLQSLYRQAQALFEARIKFLNKNGIDYFIQKILLPNQQIVDFYSRPLYKQPGFSIGLLALLKLSYLWIKIKWDKNFKPHKRWIIAYHEGDNKKLSLRKFKKLIPPPHTFWADPFVVEYKKNIYLFFEEVETNGKGKIAMMEYKDKKFTQRKIVLDKTYHLSYPMVFVENDKLFMIPETKENKTIELYQFNGNIFQFVGNLIEGIQAVDGTLHFHQNKWWLFCNVQVHSETSSNQLHVFYSNNMQGPYKPHVLNPLSCDCRVTRPAGKLFKIGNRLFRPSQDCSKEYGYGVNINEILILSEDNYQEIPVDKITPDWDNKINAIHTYNSIDLLTVVDVHGAY